MKLVRQLLTDSVVNSDNASNIVAIIGNRLYPAHIASVNEPVYPCANFQMQFGPFVTLTDTFEGSMRLYCWSTQHVGTVDECYDLFQKFVDYWHQHSFDDTTLKRYIRLVQEGPAVETFDTNVRSHSVVTPWRVFGAVTT